jgi:hypothetical protein
MRGCSVSNGRRMSADGVRLHWITEHRLLRAKPKGSTHTGGDAKPPVFLDLATIVELVELHQGLRRSRCISIEH